MYPISGIFYRNIALMLISIAVIPIMAYLNAPSLSTKIGSMAKAEFSKNGSGRGGRGIHVGKSRSAGQGRGDSNSGNRTNTRGKWKGDDAKVSAATNGGIGKQNGRSCGWNTTHTWISQKWVADPKSFPLPATHLVWSKSGKTPPEGGNSGSLIPTMATTATVASVTSV